jgi:RimJ/RimL family protein N-acetyltransferase
VLHPDWWSGGYATEAGAHAIGYAFEVIGADEVVSVILPENARSQKVAARLGLVWSEDRVLSSFPDMPHGIWRLPRRHWEVSGG